jgi:hypothetical protein
LADLPFFEIKDNDINIKNSISQDVHGGIKKRAVPKMIVGEKDLTLAPIQADVRNCDQALRSIEIRRKVRRCTRAGSILLYNIKPGVGIWVADLPGPDVR